jgi:hypothetical protein
MPAVPTLREQLAAALGVLSTQPLRDAMTEVDYYDGEE